MASSTATVSTVVQRESWRRMLYYQPWSQEIQWQLLEMVGTRVVTSLGSVCGISLLPRKTVWPILDLCATNKTPVNLTPPSCRHNLKSSFLPWRHLSDFVKVTLLLLLFHSIRVLLYVDDLVGGSRELAVVHTQTRSSSRKTGVLLKNEKPFCVTFHL